MPEQVKEAQNFEQIIAQEVGNLGLDASGLDGVEASGKVSEVVGENAGETEVKKAIAKRTRDLVNQATKLEKSKNYSAAKMEKLVTEIRYLRGLMTQLVDVTVEKLESLYRKYVWKQ